LVLLPDARVALAETFGAPMVEEHGVPAFGLLPAGTPLSRRETTLLRARVGPLNIYRVPRPGSARRPVRVATLTAPRQWLTGRLRGMERRRQLVWHGQARNATIAAAALAYADNDEARLGGLGLTVPTSGMGATPRVAVLVECPAHARSLLELLPGWSMYNAVPDDNRTASSAKAPLTSLHRAVVTSVRAASLDALATDILIDARGDGPVDLSAFPPTTTTGDGEVLLVDVRQEADRAAADASNDRLAEYCRRGYAFSPLPGQGLLSAPPPVAGTGAGVGDAL
jgi:hypothetical protein